MTVDRSTIHALLAAAALLAIPLMPSRQALALEHNVPNGVALSVDRGRVESSKEINLTVVLKMHNEAEFDKVFETLYDPASSSFHQWLTDKDFERYSPTVAEFATVKSELVKQGFTVLTEDPARFTIRVHGTVGIAEKAFQTELHTFDYKGRVYQAHVRDARLTGAAGDLVKTVSGLERHQSRPQLSYVLNPLTGKPRAKKLLASKADLAGFAGSLTDAPLTKAATVSFDDGENTAKYTGLEYTANGQTGGFTPAQLQAHYGLTSLIGAGYDGTGQTIALVEGYGYPTAMADANAAASLFGLPLLTSSTFSVVYPEGKPLNPEAGILSGWDGEIALDVQSAHAIAPGAKIVVVASSGQDNEDQLASLSYVIANKVAYTVSSSWENDSEIISGLLEEEAFTSVLKVGAAAGISFQFSSGDGGDEGLGTPVGSPGVPSNSPYATAVGGTSVLNNPYNSQQIVTGWGNNLVYLDEGFVEDPLAGFFGGGAGGGRSEYFAEPSWQSALPGNWRHVPDVSALADPYTGFALVITSGGQEFGAVVGGTSLASPIFTATWAIADQYNGTPLGFAAPAVSKLKTGDITDVVPPTGNLVGYDVQGSITDGGGTTAYNSRQIFNRAENLDAASGDLNLYNQTGFLSAVWPIVPGPTGFDIALSFGTDSSLTTTTGWDNVTGWGEPNGLPFIQGVTGKTTGAKVTKK